MPVSERGAIAGPAIDDEARESLRDSFDADMAKSQRLRGELPSVRENEALRTSFLEQFEQRVEAGRHAGATATEAESEGVAEQHAAERGFRMERLPDKEPVSVVEQWDAKTLAEFQLMNARVELLLSKQDRGPLGQPSWRECVMAVLYMRIQGAPQAQIDARLRELCDLSAVDFGDWRKTPEKPLIFA